MIDVCLLGTGGMMPLPYRPLTSLMLKYNGKSVLVDCGEGTQTQIRIQGWSFKPIDVLCITHFHADHISGLPGLLLTLGNAERTEPLTIIGPRGLARVVDSLRVIAPGLPFQINYIEIEEDREVFEMIGLRITAFRLNHSVTCYGYSFELDRAGRFDPDAAKANNIPIKFWKVLQKGENVTEDGITYTSDMVLGPPRKGLKITYCTDTRPVPAIEEVAKDSDLFICEGMYGENEKLQDARDKRHMMMQEAAEIAKAAEVKKLWLTHYSPSMTRPQEFLDEIRGIFPESYVSKDRIFTELNFEEE